MFSVDNGFTFCVILTCIVAEYAISPFIFSDAKYPLQSPDRFSKRPSDFLVPLKPGINPIPCSRSESSSRRPLNGESSMILSLPKQDGKTLQKRSVKMLNVLPCSTTGKRPKVEHGELAVSMEIDDCKISGTEILYFSS
jgi:hypothetical protein